MDKPVIQSLSPWKDQSLKWLARFKERLAEADNRPSLRRRMLLATAWAPQSETEWAALRERMLALIQELESTSPIPEFNPNRDAEGKATAAAIEEFETANFHSAPNGGPAPKQTNANDAPPGLRVAAPQPWPAASQELIEWLEAARLPNESIQLAIWRTIVNPAKWLEAILADLARGPAFPSGRCALQDVRELQGYLTRTQPAAT